MDAPADLQLARILFLDVLQEERIGREQRDDFLKRLHGLVQDFVTTPGGSA